jgi:hypothetical protein
MSPAADLDHPPRRIASQGDRSRSSDQRDAGVVVQSGQRKLRVVGDRDLTSNREKVWRKQVRAVRPMDAGETKPCGVYIAARVGWQRLGNGGAQLRERLLNADRAQVGTACGSTPTDGPTAIHHYRVGLATAAVHGEKE